MTDFRF